MRSFLLSCFALCGTLETAVASQALFVSLPEFCEVTHTASYGASSGNLVSESATQRFSPELKKVCFKVLGACDKFYNDCIIKPGNDSVINAFIAAVNREIAHSGDWHQIVFSELASRLISAGMARFVLHKHAQLPAINNGTLQEFFQFGFDIAQHISANPLELLRYEIYRDTLLEIIQPMDFPSVLEKLSNPLFDIEKICVPVSFLERIHSEREWLLTEEGTLAALLPASDDDTHSISNLRLRVFEDIVTSGNTLLTTNAYANSQKKGIPSPYGYCSDSQKLPMIPNLTNTSLTNSIGANGQLKETTKKWLICKASIRYLYENPRATVDDAVEASIRMVTGMLFDMHHPLPLGSTIEACKDASISILHFLHARSLCHIGRWKSHCPLLMNLNHARNQKFRRYYYPNIKYIGHCDAPQLKPSDLEGNNLILNQVTFPVVSRSLMMIENHGAGNCGIYATLFQSRADLVIWLMACPEWWPFLPLYLKNGRSRENLSMHGQLNGIGTIIQSDGFLCRMGEQVRVAADQILREVKEDFDIQRSQFLQLSPAEQTKQKKLHPAAKEWDERSARSSYGNALSEVVERMGSDFGFIAALHCRTMMLWQTKGLDRSRAPRLTDTASPENLTSLIIPDGYMWRSVRSRPIYWWATPGHYRALIERDDSIGSAKCIRHLEAGTAL
ncbi:MAG: hypothetical protein LBL32_02635 [Holosporales bacterium]|jgi:hypothetical protein|nr:hypothetical protein [Holosporales bacterium]